MVAWSGAEGLVVNSSLITIAGRVLMLSRSRAFWPKGYQHGSLGKSHQNSDYLQQGMWKSYRPTGFEPDLGQNARALDWKSKGLPVRFLWEDNFFALRFQVVAVRVTFILGSALVAFRLENTQTIIRVPCCYVGINCVYGPKQNEMLVK